PLTSPSTARLAASSPSAVSSAVSIAEKPPTASSLPGKVTTRWMKRQAMVGPNFKRMDRSPEKSASITVTIQPSRLADGEFFSSLLILLSQKVAGDCHLESVN